MKYVIRKTDAMGSMYWGEDECWYTGPRHAYIFTNEQNAIEEMNTLTCDSCSVVSLGDALIEYYEY